MSSEWKFVKRSNKLSSLSGLIKQAMNLVTELVDLLEKYDAHVLGDSEWSNIVIRFNKDACFSISYEQVIPIDLNMSNRVCPSRIEEAKLEYYSNGKVQLIGRLIRENGR
jgi:hypothetical protein